jgi:hypothetical protein
MVEVPLGYSESAFLHSLQTHSLSRAGAQAPALGVQSVYKKECLGGSQQVEAKLVASRRALTFLMSLL